MDRYIGTRYWRTGVRSALRRRGVPALAALALALALPAAAAAGPADLDPSFGDGGIATIPGADRYQAEGRPLAASGGRIVVAGLLRNASDRVFLSRLGPTGSVDTAFGSAGTVHTNTLASGRRAATAVTPDGRLVVAGSGEKAGRIIVERFLPSGAVDTSFGSAGNGRITVDLGGRIGISTAVVPLPDGRLLVAAASDAGGRETFTIIRLRATGLDPGFGAGNGVARVDFGTRPARAQDLVVLADGAIAVAGSVGAEGTTGADTGIARLTASGQPDPGFGRGDPAQPGVALPGRTVLDATRGGGPDHAAAVAADPGGTLFVTGPAAGAGMVARVGPSGVPDPTFGIGGVVLGGLAPDGHGLEPRDLARDGAGRLVLAGTAVAGTPPLATQRWAVARLDAGGALDDSFGAGGRALLPGCENTGGFGPVGLGVTAGGRIHVLGSCGPQGRVAVARLFGAAALGPAVELAVSPVAEAAGRQRVALSAIDPTAVLGAAEALQGAPLRSSPLRSSPLRSSPLRSSPLRSSPLRSSPLRSSPLRSSPLRSSPLRSSLLSSIPLRSSSWTAVLAPYYGAAGVPLQTLTLEDVFALSPFPRLPDGSEITLAHLDLEATPLRSSSLAALLLGQRPLDSLPAPDGGWCDFLAGQPRNCANGVDTATWTLLSLEIAGTDLRSYYAQPLSLGATELGEGDDRAGLARIRIADVAIEHTPFGRVPVTAVPGIANCASGTLAECQAGYVSSNPDGFSDATLGDLIGRLPISWPGGGLQDVSLGQVLTGLVPAEDIPYERGRLADILAGADAADPWRRRGDDARLQTWTVAFRADCGQAAHLTVELTLPQGGRMVPGSATARVDGGPPVSVDDPRSPPLEGLVRLPLGGVCGQRDEPDLPITLTLAAEPGYELGDARAEVAVAGHEPRVLRATAPVAVDDSLDAPAELDPATARRHGDEHLYTGHISGPDDLDSYLLRDLEPGARVTVALSNLPADYDLLVYGPPSAIATAPLRSSPLRSSPLRSSALPDSSREPATDARTLPPDTLQDLPLRSSPLRSSPLRSSPLRSSSINRGALEESATFVVRESDAGGDFAVQVAGFNDASSPRPYVLRIKVTEPQPPPPCQELERLSRPDDAGQGLAAVPEDARTLIVTNRRRLERLYGTAATAALWTRLEAFAARSDVRGTILTVEDDPAVNAAYVALDGDPCSPAAANAVAEEIHRALEERRDGRSELRYLTIAGSDRIVPQARVEDLTVLSNESDYADDAMAGGRDTPVSRALRSSYLLSDVVYGDRDPQERQGATLFVADTAVGRLVETPAEIESQLDRYVAADGVLDPQTSFVTGYDFIKDGAEAIFAGLRGGASDTKLVDETWTAGQARAGMNRAGGGYTSINAHYDHFRLLPADAFNGLSANLFESSDADPAPGSVIFNIGCHGGLNIPDVSVSFPADRDWAQAVTAKGALYAANTGFGYGDTEVVAYSERQMAEFASNLGSRTMTIGQALMFANQRYAALLGAGDDYDAKVLHQATLYGPPMYRIGSGGEAPPAALAPAGTRPAGEPATTRSSTFEVRPALRRVDTARGSYHTADGQPPLAIQHRPIQPRTAIDVTAADGLPVHGALIEALTTREEGPVDPVYALPTVDLSGHEPEPAADPAPFPALTHAVASEATPAGRRDRLELVLGQLRHEDGQDRQLLVERVAGRALRSDSRDWDPPLIEHVAGAIDRSGTTVTFRVEADPDAAGGVVLYQAGTDGNWPDTWSMLRLDRVAGTNRLRGSAAIAQGTRVRRARIQVFDGAGNVGQAHFKAEGVSADNLGGSEPQIVLEPGRPGSGWFQEDETAGLHRPSLRVDPGDSDGNPFQVTVDGTVLFAAHGPPYPSFLLPEEDEGFHEVVARDTATGATAAVEFGVDERAPTATVAPPPGLVVVAAAGGVITGTAEDPPKVSGRPTSGVAGVTVTFTRTGAPSHQVAAALDCDSAHRSCRWTVPPPPTGLWSVTATAVDRSGRQGAASAPVLVSVS